MRSGRSYRTAGAQQKSLVGVGLNEAQGVAVLTQTMVSSERLDVVVLLGAAGMVTVGVAKRTLSMGHGYAGWSGRRPLHPHVSILPKPYERHEANYHPIDRSVRHRKSPYRSEHSSNWVDHAYLPGHEVGNHHQNLSLGQHAQDHRQ